MQGMQGFAGPSHCSCISSHLHRLRGVASSQSFSSSQLAPRCPVVRRQGDTKFAIRTITMRPGAPRPSSASSPVGSQFIPTSARRWAESSEPSSQKNQLPAPDSPGGSGRVSIACQREGFQNHSPLRARCFLERRLPTVTEMRDWRVAHGPGLHGPPAGARPRIPSLERLQIDPETCVVTNPLGAPIFVPYPAVHM
jgi:hypothetical protein